jgi:hypothetical protein
MEGMFLVPIGVFDAMMGRTSWHLNCKVLNKDG